MTGILGRFYQEFGIITRIIPPVVGKVLQFTMKLEDNRLKNGWTYDPKTIYKRYNSRRRIASFPSETTD